jgi:hypothetical protein
MFEFFFHKYTSNEKTVFNLQIPLYIKNQIIQLFLKRRDWDLNPGGAKLHRISSPAPYLARLSRLSIKKHLIRVNPSCYFNIKRPDIRSYLANKWNNFQKSVFISTFLDMFQVP